MENLDVYFAGLFDGEGCVLINKSKPKANQNPCYTLHVVVAMVDRRPLDLLVKTYGVGTIYDAHYGRLTLSPAFQMKAAANGAAKFLRAIRPYTIIKSDEIDIALAFQEHVLAHKARLETHHRAHGPEIIRYRENARNELKRLKRRFRFHQPTRESYQLNS